MYASKSEASARRYTGLNFNERSATAVVKRWSLKPVVRTSKRVSRRLEQLGACSRATSRSTRCLTATQVFWNACKLRDEGSKQFGTSRSLRGNGHEVLSSQRSWLKAVACHLILSRLCETRFRFRLGKGRQHHDSLQRGQLLDQILAAPSRVYGSTTLTEDIGQHAQQSDRVVPIISPSISCESLGKIPCRCCTASPGASRATRQAKV